ncbi:zinc ribbon domain-containing protein [Collinsella bouchesdurhonensis]|uniref:zinc ribbon domain-containing protein n=1 Tax=Collinsella bouchesdurhonensis TaxID=1907654 RepID=UPI0024B5F4E0|nr:zinc-ribbon domain-containing protein [Collinsella bouchesdurhonensis]
MFCAKCGNKLSDGARFCVNCGAPVAARDGTDVPVSAQGDAQGGDAPDATVAAPVLAPADATSDAAPGPDTVSAEPEAASAADASAAPADTAAKKKKTPFIIAAAILVIVIIGVAAFFLLGNKGAGDIEFGQDTEVELAVTTVIKPRGKDGNLMNSYDAYLINEKAKGDVSSIKTTPYHLTVKGDQGFKPSDFKDLPNNRYTLVIVDHDSDDADSEQKIPVNYDKENKKAPSEAIIAVPSKPHKAPAKEDGKTDEQKAYGLFLDKIKELTDTYGASGSTEWGGSYNLATGLCVADLVDFDGDGMNELFVVYNTQVVDFNQEACFDKQKESFKTEVWAYRDGKISKVFDKSVVQGSNGGIMWACVYQKDSKFYLVTFDTAYEDLGDGAYNETTDTFFHAYDGSKFKQAASTHSDVDVSSGPADETYTVNGEDASFDEMIDFQSSFSPYLSYDLVSFIQNDNFHDEGTYYPVNDLPSLVAKTTQALEAGAATKKDDTAKDASYSADIKTVSVPVPDASSDVTPRVDTDWTYLQFSKDGKPDGCKDLNAKLKESFDADVDATSSWRLDLSGNGNGAAEVLQNRYDTMVSLDGSIACVFQERYYTAGGPHGWNKNAVVYYDLSKGTEVDADVALGIDKDTLAGLASDAIDAFAHANPGISDTGDVRDHLYEMDRYGRDKAGIFFITRDYEMGTYADGSHVIYIKALNGDDGLVGTSGDFGN